MSSSPSNENTVMIENPLGFMTKTYFLKVIQGLKFITEKDLPMITRADTDRDGKVSFDEFYNIMTKKISIDYYSLYFI